MTETIIKGVRPGMQSYAEHFERHEVNGRKLALLEPSDLEEMSIDNSSHQLHIFKSIQNLLNVKHNIGRETLQMILFTAMSRLKSVQGYAEAMTKCACMQANGGLATSSNNSCSRCVMLQQELVSSTSSAIATYRKLITWLVKQPFARIKAFVDFREEINLKMKSFVKMSKRRVTDHLYADINSSLADIMASYKSILDYGDQHCDQENGKVSLAHSCCFFEKVSLTRRFEDQALGISVISLVDGVFTIVEVAKESMADECSRLNVEDDIIFVNNQVVTGWNIDYLYQYMEEAAALALSHQAGLTIVLRKMPRDNLTTLKHHQQRSHMMRARHDSHATKHDNKFKCSLSDLLNENGMLEYSSEEDEIDERASDTDTESDFNTSLIDVLSGGGDSTSGKHALKSTSHDIVNFSVQRSGGGKNNAIRFGKAKMNRLFRSMQNLLSYDKSKSNSADNLSSNSNRSLAKSSHPHDKEKSTSGDTLNHLDAFKSLFSHRKFSVVKTNSESPSSSTKRLGGGGGSCGDHDGSLGNIASPTQTAATSPIAHASTATVSRKPPLDKRAYKTPVQKPTVHGWLYKRKYPIKSSSLRNNTHQQQQQQQQRPVIVNANNSKWRYYWCVLFKDYITFYKNSDEKSLKDFLHLKSFLVLPSQQHKLGFVLVDKGKQLEYEFYAESADDYRDWHQALVDLQNRQSSSSASGSGGIEQQQQQKASLALNDEEVSAQTTSDSPTLVKQSSQQQQQHQLPRRTASSSRESSPCQSSMVSRDSSPNVNSPRDYMLTTSESDVEQASSSTPPTTTITRGTRLTPNAQRNKHLCEMNKHVHHHQSSSSVLSSAAKAAASAGLLANNKKKANYSSPQAVTTSASNFPFDTEYRDDDENDGDKDGGGGGQLQPHARSSSLPGALHACVGSFMSDSLVSRVADRGSAGSNNSSPARQEESTAPKPAAVSNTPKSLESSKNSAVSDSDDKVTSLSSARTSVMQIGPLLRAIGQASCPQSNATADIQANCFVSTPQVYRTGQQGTSSNPSSSSFQRFGERTNFPSCNVSHAYYSRMKANEKPPQLPPPAGRNMHSEGASMVAQPKVFRTELTILPSVVNTSLEATNHGPSHFSSNG